MIAYSIEIRKDHMFAQFSASLQQRSMSIPASVEFEVLSLFDEENDSILQYMTIATIESRGTYMWALKIDSKTVSVFSSSKIGTPISDLNTFSGENQKMFDAAQAIGCPVFTLVSISVLNWSYDMIPWGGHSALKN